ncbi:DUF1000-domain-containing protein [Neoconidiobolus thromboides FSU 785]|nr:DUF1000-domain-containing protein [Neoconidiobolus thromboides FSU 785]
MPIKSIKTLSEYQQVIANSSDKLLIMQFTASWCGPCRAISPRIIELSNKNLHIGFYKIDLDEAGEIASHENVTSIPTLKIYKNQGMLEELSGGQCLPRLEELVRSHQSTNDDASSKFGLTGQSDITSLIQKNQIESLNLRNEDNISNIFDNQNDKVVQSDADEQILINLQFSQAVKIHSIKFQAPLNNAPKNIKLFSNKYSLGFDDVTSMEPTQELILESKDYEENSVTNLRFVKFQNVNALSIFIEDNLNEDEITSLKNITIFGQPVHTTNMNDLNRK